MTSARLSGLEDADSGDAPGADADVADPGAVLVDDRAPFQHQVESPAHCASAACLRLPARIRKTDAGCNRSGETMTETKIALLPDRGVVSVTGEDAEKFLQGVITNEMGLLATQPAIHAGMLTPQGKILFDFFVVKAPEGYLPRDGAG